MNVQDRQWTPDVVLAQGAHYRMFTVCIYITVAYTAEMEMGQWVMALMGDPFTHDDQITAQ